MSLRGRGGRVRGRRHCALISALLVVIGTLVPVLSVGQTSAGAVTTVVPITNFRDLDRAPDGRILVSGDDRVLVYDSDGVLLTAIPDVFGAADIDVRGGHAYVVQSSAGAVADIDLATYARSDITVGTSMVAGGIAVLPDAIWFLTTGPRVARFDRTTSAVTIPSNPSVAGRVIRVPGDDSRLVLTPQFSGSIQVISATAPHPVVNFSSSLLQSMASATPTDRGTVIVSVGNAIRELDLDDLSWATPVRSSPDTTSASFVAWSPGATGTVAWGSSRTSFVGDDTSTTLSHIHNLSAPSSNQCIRALALDAGATSLAHLTQDSCSSSTNRLVIEPLAPQVATVAPVGLVEGVSADITITGNGLGELGAVTVGGIPVTPSSVSPTRVVVPSPATLAPGTYDLVVTTDFGTWTRQLTVAPDVGALLQGTVRRSGTPVAGAPLTLEGSAIPGLLTATTGSNGTFSFPALPFGTDYRLTVTDPSGAQPPQVIRGITMRPNDPTTVDPSLVARSTTGTTLATATLPATTSRDLARHDGTGRTFVAVGDEIDVLSDGAITHRLLGFPGVSALAVSGGSVFALLPGTNTVVRLDATTLAPTGSWGLPATAASTLAPAAGRIWTVTSPSSFSFAYTALDPATGAVTSYPASASNAPRLLPVVGDGNLLLSNDGASSGTLRVLDVGSGSPAVVASASGALPAHGDAVHNRVWLPNGTELRLSDLGATGLSYPISANQSGYQNSGVGVSGTPGGVIVFGRNLVQRGTPRVTHSLASAPTLRPIVDTSTASVLAVGSSTVSTVSLAPSLTGPTNLYAEPQTLTVAGQGLGGATSARVDGAPVTIGVKTATSVELVLPSLGAGPHSIDVTTPWGTTPPLTATAVVRTPTPTISAVVPSTLPTAGGTVTLSGSGFTGATEVRTLGPSSVVASSLTVIDDSTLTATFPPRTPGTVTVSVTTAGGGASAAGPPLSFVAPVPAVTGIAPASGPSTGGTTVTISGSGFMYASAVKFGTANATGVTVVSDTEIRAVAPQGAAGAADVRVTTSGGTSPGTPSSVFTYTLTPAVVTNVSPSSGPSAGGTLVTLTGTGFTTVQRVQFGEAEAAYVVTDPTRIVAVAPPGSGVVNVRVTTSAGASTSTLSNRFTYVAPDPGSVRGVVRSSAGPLAGMAVVLSRPDRFEAITHVLTAPDGSFEIPGISPGDYRVLTLDPASLFGASEYYLAELYEDAGSLLDDVSAATPVTVAAGQPTVLDPIVLTYSNPGSMSGVVRDTVGHELAGMEVIVSPAAALDSSISVLTGPDGRFHVPDLAPGSYRVVTVDPAEAAGATAHYITEVYDDAGGLSSFASAPQVTVGPGGAVELDPIELRHSSPGSITATVTSPAGVPLQHMVVLVSNADEFVVAGANVTAANGTIAIGNLPPGDYKVGIFDARVIFGVAPLWASEVYDNGTTFETGTRVTVQPGTARSLGMVRLAPFVP